MNELPGSKPIDLMEWLDTCAKVIENERAYAASCVPTEVEIEYADSTTETVTLMMPPPKVSLPHDSV